LYFTSVTTVTGEYGIFADQKQTAAEAGRGIGGSAWENEDCFAAGLSPKDLDKVR
jgi:hypothetical protein